MLPVSQFDGCLWKARPTFGRLGRVPDYGGAPITKASRGNRLCYQAKARLYVYRNEVDDPSKKKHNLGGTLR